MNPLLLLLILGGGAVMVMKNANSANSAGTDNSAGGVVTRSNPWGLPDIDSANQGGAYDTSYDESFEKASGATGVPFALLKAHGIRESSLNPNATHNDGGTLGSQGLMQIEWNSDSGSSYYDRLSIYGDAYSGDNIADGTTSLSDPDVSALLGAYLIRDNLNRFGAKGSIQGIRDSINAYNTGKSESVDPAPANYVAGVLNYYGAIIGQPVTPG